VIVSKVQSLIKSTFFIALTLGSLFAGLANAQTTVAADQPLPKNPTIQAKLTPAEYAQLIAYLRCDRPAALTKYSEVDSAPVIQILSQLKSELSVKDTDVNVPTLTLDVWGAGPGEIQVAAGYGYFVLMQYYPESRKAPLMTKINRHTWTTVKPNLQQKFDASNELVTYHEWLAVDEKIKRAVRLVEKKVYLDKRTPMKPGVMVSCSYQSAR
jgi:hypothetical protein